ncbi:MAG: peroxiredoxin [Candidatus Thermoplasmatota archaeon]|jgi:alkyl hydroperoxide reductase subunit AhpC|nr:peroxiredoxin [Candidatus Thermoplasmatota archaeon]MCL5790292.1 peroxiredoxin [Candidatus Thermoplasmatota archaeon]
MIGKKAPDFDAKAFVNGRIEDFRLSKLRGKWVILFFYPADFTFVCPTEIEGFAEKYNEFKKAGAEIVAVSRDTVFVHQAWVEYDDRVSKAKYPMVEDRKGEISRDYGVLDDGTGNSQRGLFIINPEGVIKYMVVTDDNVGRSTDETYRVLAALQTGERCPVDWRPGKATLKV